MIFNDVPVYPLCQISKEFSMDIVCHGEAIQESENVQNDFVWPEMQNVSDLLSTGTFKSQNEDENFKTFSKAKSPEENQESNTNKDVEIKKTLADLENKVSGWQEALRSHLKNFDLSKESDYLQEEIKHINSLCSNIKQAQGTIQNNFEYLEDKCIKNNLDFWLKILDHVSNLIYSKKMHENLVLEWNHIQDIFEYIC